MQINVYPHQFVKKLKLKNEFNTKLLFYMAKKKKRIYETLFYNRLPHR